MFSHSSAVSLNHHWPTWLWPVFWPDLIPTHPTRSWPAGHTCSKIRLQGGNCSLLTSVELCTFAQFFEKNMKDCEGTHTVCWHPLSVQAPSGMHWVDYTHLSWPCMNSASRYRHQKTKGVWSKKTAIASQRKQHKCFLYSRARTSATAAERYDLAVIRNQHQQMPNPVSACPQGGSNDPLATFSRGLLHVRSGPSAPPYRANCNMTCWGSFSWTHHGWIILDRKEAKDGIGWLRGKERKLAGCNGEEEGGVRRCQEAMS